MSAVMENSSIDATDGAGKTALWHAIERGNTEDVERILKTGADVNKTYHSRQTPLMFAVEKGHAEYLQVIFDAGANIDSCNTFGMSSIMIAAKKGHLDCLRMLVNAGANLHLRDIRGRTALMVAVEENSCECTEYLVEVGANIHQHDSKGISALMVAIHENCKKCLQSLVQAGASVDECSRSGIAPLMVAAERGSCVLHALIQLGANLDLRDNRGRTSTIYAARGGHVNCLLQLVQSGAHLDLTDDQKQTALMIAAETGHLECVECLVNGGAKLELRDSNGRTALMLAAASGHYDVLQALLQCGEQWKDLQCKTKRTALIYAVVGLREEYEQQLNMSMARMIRTNTAYRNLTGLTNSNQSIISSKCLQVLLAAGANPNICDINGMSPLMHAAIMDTSGELLKQLIEAGADINLTERSYKKTALILASCYGNVKYIRKLVEAGAPVNIGSSRGETPLMCLAMKSDSSSFHDTIVFLLDHGADVNAQDQFGTTPLMFAARSSTGINVMSLLISRGADINKTSYAGLYALDYTIGSNDDLLMNAKYLLENGANPNITSTRNRESLLSQAIQSQNISFLLLFLRNNLDSQIVWDDFYFMIVVGNKRMLQVVVLESLMPAHVQSLKWFNDMSVLRNTLNLGCLGIAKYFLAIGYLSIIDLYRGKPNVRVGNSSHWQRNPQLKPFFDSVYSQPWPLVKLAFVVVSSNIGASPKRKDRIKNSGLPDRLQRMLLFQEPISKLCIKHWDKIPLCFNPQDYENLPKPRPLLYYWPFGHDLMPCDHNCSECSQTGYKFV